MNKDKIILITTLENARNLLNSVACEASTNNSHEKLCHIVYALGDFERELKNDKQRLNFKR